MPSVLIELTGDRLDTAALIERTHRQDCGAVVTFEGTVRSPNSGVEVTRLEYEAYEDLANDQLKKIGLEIGSKYGAGSVLAAHRIGSVLPGEVAMVVSVATHSRQAAFAATAELVDRIKAEVAIWKKEVTAAGDFWQGLPIDMTSDPTSSYVKSSDGRV